MRGIQEVEITLNLEIYVDVTQKDKLPHDVVRAIEIFRGMGVDNSGIIEMAMLGGISPTAHVIKDFACTRPGGFNTLIAALKYGYVIEESA